MWSIYIVKCADGSLYTGCAIDVVHRVIVHNAGNGAKYTRARRPVRLVYQEACTDRSTALQREAAIKKLSRLQKEELISHA
jgi:predicted GIY-YIG superfamily endonuclease